MPTDFNLRRGLHPKRWEAVTPNGNAGNAGGSLIISPDLTSVWQEALCLASLTLRSRDTGGWTPLPSFGSVVNNSGSEGTWHPNGPTGTVSAASPNSITTNLTPLRRLDGITVRLTGGTGAGQERVVVSNTMGANSVLTVDQPWTIQPDATTTWLLRSGRYYVIGPATLGSVFKYFDPVLWSWSSALASPSGRADSFGSAMAATCFTPLLVNQSVTSATGTTLTTVGKNWAVNQWRNQQVRITSGKGAGQIRIITGNTATDLTVAAWVVTPDSSSKYTIEGAEDYLYEVGNASTTTRRYSLSANTWTTLAARSVVADSGVTLTHIDRDPSALWSDETNFINGRYLYSIRGIDGAGSTAIDKYDITSDVWSPVVYSPVGTLFGWGDAAHYVNGILYIQGMGINSGATIPWYKLRPSAGSLEPWTTLTGPTFLGKSGPRSYVTSRVGTDGRTYYYFYQSSVVAGATASSEYRIQEIPLCPKHTISATGCIFPHSRTWPRLYLLL